MAVLERNREPSRSELNWFGLLLLAVAGIVGGIVLWRFRAATVSYTIWSIGAVIALVYYVVPPLRRAIYFGWMYATYPIGWVVSHAMLATIFYGIITPMGLVMRTFGWDPMRMRIDRTKTRSHWIAHNPHKRLEGYFRQF